MRPPTEMDNVVQFPHRPSAEPATTDAKPVVFDLEDHAGDLPPKLEPEPEPLSEVLDAVSAHISRFVVLTPAQLDAVVLWVAHTHIAELYDHTPRLAVVSPEPGSGKTRLLSDIEALVRNPIPVVNPTVASLFHMISDAEVMPTILLDEADTIFGRGGSGESPRGLIDAGHRIGATYPRVTKNGTTYYEVFAPMAIAGLKTVHATIRSRSVIIRMRRRRFDQVLDRARHRDLRDTGNPLRDRLVVALDALTESLTDLIPKFPDEVADRDADVWEPLLAIADAAGGAWPERARIAAVTLVTDAKDRGESDGITLLRDAKWIYDAIQKKGTTDRITSAELLAKLKDLDGSPWGRSSFTYRALSDMLREFDINPPKPLNTGDTTARGYLWEWFIDAWSRYLPS